MSDTRNFWKGVFLGAIAGGALSMLDKNTRVAVTTKCRKTTKNVTYLIKNPSVVVDKVKSTTEQVRQTIDQVSEDFYFIKEKVDELTEVTPQVIDIVKETKDAFVQNENTYDDEDYLVNKK
jgi:gas vesicle protein